MTQRAVTSSKSGITEAQYLYSLTKRPKLRSLQANRNHKGSLQKTSWGNSISGRKIGDLITADHKVLNEGGESRNNHRYAVVVQDPYPYKTKTSQETERSLRQFLEPSEKPRVIYTDNSLEFGKSCENLSGNHRTSTLHRSETNGKVQRAVRRMKDGTSVVLLQSGLDEKWWAGSLECHCYLRNIQDLLADGKTHYERRFGEPFKGHSIWFTGRISPCFCERPVATASIRS